MKKWNLLIWSCLLSVSIMAQSDRLTPELLWDLGRVSLEDVALDGKTLYGVRHYDVATDKGNSALYLLDPSSRAEAKKVLDSYNGNARFTPDGKRIAYLGDGGLMEINLDGSDKREVAKIEMNGFAYSPKGNHILFIQDVKFDKTPTEIHKDLPLATARIMDDLMYRHWKNWHDYKYSNIFFAPYKDGKLAGRPINIINDAYDSPLNPFGGMEQITWSPDGSKIAYTCKKKKGKEWAKSTNSDIYVYDISSGDTYNLTKGMNGYDIDPVFSPDGTMVAWNSMKRDGFESDRNRVFISDIKGNKKVELTEGLDRSMNHPQWSADGKTIYCTAGVRATNQFFSIDVASKKSNQLTKGVHNYYGFGVSKGGIIASRASMSMPHELYQVDLKDGKSKQLTYINKAIVGKLKMGEVKERTVKTTDGKDMLVWMIYPPDFDPTKKYPTLLYCQGGPQSAVSQFWSYRWNFQLMAANKYIIVAPNRRGLPSFGREWNDAISGDWGGQAMKDYLSAIDDAKKEPYVDADRLGAVGASYGGYSVYWLAGNHQKRFKSFISHCGLFNLESWYGTTEELFFADFDLKGAYWDKPQPKSYQTDSPHDYVQNWDTPILVIHNEKDFRVPLGEGMQAFQAAQLKGLKSRFLYYPDEGHWVQKPQNGILWHREFFKWLEETL